MRRNSAGLALVFSTLCAGCHWTGGGFHTEGPEMARLRQVLNLETSSVVADVGAGKGELTLALAAAAGHVFSTELDPGRLGQLREAVAAAKLGNVTVLESQSSGTGLPPNCCDAIVMRRVYHHLAEPSGVNASLFRSLRAGGVLAVIDFPPPLFFGRGGFGVPADSVVSELGSSGFELVRRMDDWPGRGPLPSYCVVFRKP